MKISSNYLFYMFRLVLIVADFILINLVFGFVFMYLTSSYDFTGTMFKHYLLLINVLWLLSANFFEMYKEKNITRSGLIYKTTIKSFLLHISLVLSYMEFTTDTNLSYYFLGMFYSALGMAFIASRLVGTLLEVGLKRKFNSKKQVAVLGNNHTAGHLAEFFKSNKNNFNFEGFLNEEIDSYVDKNGKLLPEVIGALEIAFKKGIKEIYVPLTMGLVEAGKLLNEAEKQCIRLKFVPICSEKSIYSHLKVDDMGEFQVISLRKEPLEDMDNRFKKRFFDILFSSLVIIFLLSWLYPLIAVIIKMQSKGPVLFKQLRSGRDNKTFTCLKFRTMCVNTDSDSVQATKDDKRVTAFGAFMRKTSIDELPQFFNVLMGNMSVVGPRPHMLVHTEKYSAIIAEFMVRHFTKPGITGWAQVNGFRGETKKPMQMKKRVEHDIWYLGNWSAILDVKIVFLTVFNVIKGESNAY
jgi:putative colanic acid biosynthesis UDP-glucose lipid carrier transferase